MVQDFISEFYEPEDIFYVGFKSREANPQVTWFHKPHTIESFLIELKKIQKMNERYKKDVYLSLNTFKSPDKGRFEHNVRDVRYQFFDIDYDAENIKNRIIDELGEPTYIIKTSKNKYQLLYGLEGEVDPELSKRISKTLSEYFGTDHTFDLARVFRCPYLINNKNGFEVKIEKLGVLNRLERFTEFINSQNIPLMELDEKKPKQSKKTENKSLFDVESEPTTEPAKNNSNKKSVKKLKKASETTKYNSKNKYIGTYEKQVEKVEGDRSRADLAFVRFLMYRHMSFENAIKNLEQVRDDLFTKHGHEIEHYINNLAKATMKLRK